MKKIILGLAVTAAALLSSCSMDTKNFGVMSQEVAIQSLNDVHKYNNGLYMQLRSITAGTYIARPEIQADKFVGTIIFSNRIGNFSTSSINASDGDIESMYQSMYNVINDVNFIVPKIEAMLEDDQFDADQKLQLRNYLGEAHFVRGYCYWYLLDHWTNPMDANGLGLQIWDTYSPSGNRSVYPSRSSMSETLSVLNGELTAAFDNIKAYEDAGNLDNCGPNASRISSYAVAALQSRVALITGDNQAALSKAEYVINSGYFDLTGLDDYASLWVNDEGEELIFVPFSSNTESCPDTGNNWIYNTQKNSSDYIPVAEALVAYDVTDVRFDAFFEAYRMEMQGLTVPAYAFSKFPGNPALFTTTSNNFHNKPKPFRLSELYLIAAEVCAADGATKNESAANGYLNDLREKRIEGYTRRTLSGAQLIQAIRDERAKELIGEGFRLSDLRRWGMGFNRQAQFDAIGLPSVMQIVQNNTNNIVYNPGDYRYTWPIPQFEFTVNPNIAGPQNTGY